MVLSFIPLTERTLAIENINKCMDEIKIWMSNNYLKVNFGKTDTIFLRNPYHHSLFDGQIRCTIQEKVFVNSFNQSVESLGCVLDCSLSMENMVLQCIRACYFNLKKLGGIQRYLSSDH